MRLPTLCVAGVLAIAGLGAAAPTSALSQVEGGLWEISRTGALPQRLCVAEPAALAQYEHRSASCTRSLIREAGPAATIRYTCPGGGFGQSTITRLTPRSLRIETQGIADGAPFQYRLQARRIGNCPTH